MSEHLDNGPPDGEIPYDPGRDRRLHAGRGHLDGRRTAFRVHAGGLRLMRVPDEVVPSRHADPVAVGQYIIGYGAVAAVLAVIIAVIIIA
jgi:hypothetical protein